MYFQKIEVADPMGEVFTVQDFDCLAHNIHRLVKKRVVPGAIRVVELGTWSGQSTLAAAQPHVLVHAVSSWQAREEETEKIHWLSGRLGVGIDEVLKNKDGHWSQALSYEALVQFIKNTNGHVFRTVMPLNCLPLDAAEWWPEKVDALVVVNDSGSHLLRDVIRQWSRHIVSGGYVFGVYRDHTVRALTGLGSYTIDGTIWRLRIQGALV